MVALTICALFPVQAEPQLVTSPSISSVIQVTNSVSSIRGPHSWPPSLPVCVVLMLYHPWVLLSLLDGLLALSNPFLSMQGSGLWNHVVQKWSKAFMHLAF